MTRDAKRFLIVVGVAVALIACVSLIFTLLGVGGSAVGEFKDYEVTGEVKLLEVEIGAADFRIEKGEEFSVRSNLNRLTFRQTGSKLIISESSFGNRNYDGAELVIYIPDGTVFSEVDITTGAGRFTAEKLSAERLDLEFGAGEVNIGELNASVEADIEGGAGKITIGGGSLCNLSFEMGVGELNLASAIVGNSELDLGVGEANITLLGSMDDYTLDLNKGIGDIRLDGESVSGGKIGSGENKVEINGGIGSINLFFK
ncbi:MAG: DUF4097 family beta strand repeat protein [Clostridia bacterium]|nr:DUF4097 family beta strand repeat protein [Clostridia bacterium]